MRVFQSTRRFVESTRMTVADSLGPASSYTLPLTQYFPLPTDSIAAAEKPSGVPNGMSVIAGVSAPAVPVKIVCRKHSRARDSNLFLINFFHGLFAEAPTAIWRVNLESTE